MELRGFLSLAHNGRTFPLPYTSAHLFKVDVRKVAEETGRTDNDGSSCKPLAKILLVASRTCILFTILVHFVVHPRPRSFTLPVLKNLRIDMLCFSFGSIKQYISVPL